MASELIIQFQLDSLILSCEKFDNMPTAAPVYLAICFTNSIKSEQLACKLKNDIIATIKAIEPNFSASTPRCGGGTMPFMQCQALDIKTNTKLLIVVSDGTTNILSNGTITNWKHGVMPVYPQGTQIGLPAPLNTPQASIWQSDINEIIPDLFGLIGINDSDKKIFISYRRTDATDIAEQLFNKLHQFNYDVFLDRFSINPGTNFQDKLYEELLDKSMVVFIESADFLNSSWIQLEIAFAKKYRLGYLAINIDNSPKTPSIEDENRISIISTSNAATGKQISPNELDLIIAAIKKHHSVSMYRKKLYLTQNVLAALSNAGAQPTLDNQGFICVSDRNNKEHRILTTSRPPSISNYYDTHTKCSSKEKSIIGPWLQGSHTDKTNKWLSGVSSIRLFNEGDILELVKHVY